MASRMDATSGAQLYIISSSSPLSWGLGGCLDELAPDAEAFLRYNSWNSSKGMPGTPDE